MEGCRTQCPSMATDAKEPKIHSGFLTQYVSVRDFIHQLIESNKPKKIVNVGHSLGEK